MCDRWCVGLACDGGRSGEDDCRVPGLVEQGPAVAVSLSAVQVGGKVDRPHVDDFRAGGPSLSYLSRTIVLNDDDQH